jgi:hypothetical protein
MILGDWLDADDIGCFKFLETAINLNWLEADQKCEEIGGYLAELRSSRYICKMCYHLSNLLPLRDEEVDLDPVLLLMRVYMRGVPTLARGNKVEVHRGLRSPAFISGRIHKSIIIIFLTLNSMGFS